MTAQEARDHLASLGLSQQGFARLTERNPTTARRWLQYEDTLDIPREVGLLLELPTPAKVKALIRASEIVD